MVNTQNIHLHASPPPIHSIFPQRLWDFKTLFSLACLILIFKTQSVLNLFFLLSFIAFLQKIYKKDQDRRLEDQHD